MLQLLVGAVGVITFLRWFSCAYRQLPALGARELQFTSRSAVAWWFVPIAFFWVPLRIAIELWKGSDPSTPATNRASRRAMSMPILLGVWGGTWQLFKFTRREGFPRASSFWWTLIPIVGVVMVWRQLDDLKKAAGSKARVHPKLIVALFVAGSLALQAGRLANRSLAGLLLILLLAFLLTGFAIHLAQRSITSCLRATYPLERERRLSVGEVAATLLSLLLSAAVGGLLYYW